MVRKDETYWTRWAEEHDEEAMKAEIIDLGNELFDAKANGWSDDRIVKAGRRQAGLVHLLLEFYKHPDDVADLATELGKTPKDLYTLDRMHLAARQDGTTASPELN